MVKRKAGSERGWKVRVRLRRNTNFFYFLLFFSCLQRLASLLSLPHAGRHRCYLKNWEKTTVSWCIPPHTTPMSFSIVLMVSFSIHVFISLKYLNRLFVSITKPPPPPPPTPRLALSVIGWGEETTDTSDLFSVIVASQFNMDCEHSSCIQVIFPRCQTILVV